MPRPPFATVCGEVYRSKTALQQAWRERVKRCPHKTTCLGHKLKGKDAAVCWPDAKDVEWFVTAAASVESHVRYLFGAVTKDRLFNEETRAAELAKALSHTTAYVSNVPSGMGTSRKRSKAKHQVHRCVYFRALQHSEAKDRAVPLTLGETPEVKQKKLTTRWLRESVSAQIRKYVRNRKAAAQLSSTKKYKPYSCALCGLGLAHKENHVDHGAGEHSFKHLVKRFETQVLERPVTAADGQDEHIVHKWQKFHQFHAQLSLTCAKCNLLNK